MTLDPFAVLVFPGLLSAIAFGFLYEGIMRKITARMHHRRGPPVWQPFFDWIKTMGKENITPSHANGFLMTLCPIASFAAAAAATVFIPVSSIYAVNFEGNIFVFAYFVLLSVVFLAIGGFATASPFGIIGSVREITQIISYELPFITSVVALGFLTNFTVSPLVSLAYPFATAGIILGVMGKLGLPPFHIPEAEQEIVEGPLTEYTGPRLGLFMLAKAALLWALVSFSAVILLGGGGVIDFFIESFIILFLLIFLKNIFSRLRISQAFKFYWMIAMPLIAIDLARIILGM